MNNYKKGENMKNPLLTADYQLSKNYEDDYEVDERTTSTSSLSDNDRLNMKDERISSARSSTTIRGGSRNNSGNGKNSSAGPNVLLLPTSDSQYYASMSSAPTGFSISYHKRMTKGNDDLRIQAALGRLQQQSKQGTASGGTSQLMVCHLYKELMFILFYYFWHDILFFCRSSSYTHALSLSIHCSVAIVSLDS